MYSLHHIRVQVSILFTVGSLMAVTAQGHEIFNDILTLAPTMYVMDVLGTLATVFTWYETINTIAEVVKVDGAVLCHGSLLLRCVIICSILLM